MVALRLHAVGLLLILIQVEAMAPWNSTDMIYKESADKKTQAQRLSELQAVQAKSSHIDALLSGNKSILSIIEAELKTRRESNVPLENEIKKVTGHLMQAKKVLAEKKKVLDEGTKKANETAESVVKAQAALSEAQKIVTEKHAANNTAMANLQKAEDYLQQIVIMDPQKVLAARHAVDLKKKELADDSKVFEDANHQLAAKTKALGSAKTAASKASTELTEATKAHQDAVGNVGALEAGLKRLKDKDTDPQMRIHHIEEALKSQEAIVKTLNDHSRALHNEIRAKNKTCDEISETVDKDAKCIDRLQTDEGSLYLSTYRFNLSAAAYEAATGRSREQMFGALWTLKDQKDADTDALIQAQKDCAPKDVEIPDELHRPKCGTDTGGTCAWLGCRAERHSECDLTAHKCICPPGTCAVEGICARRPSPVLLASPSTELPAEPAATGAVFLANRPSPVLLASTSTELLAEPAATGAVFLARRPSPVLLASTSTELLAEPAATGAFFLAASTLMMTAFLVMRRRRASEIRMPENILG